MTDIELTNKAIIWLAMQSRIYITRPHRFGSKEVADAVGGAYSRLGVIQEIVISELNARGVKIHYVRLGRKMIFELL